MHVQKIYQVIQSNITLLKFENQFYRIFRQF